MRTARHQKATLVTALGAALAVAGLSVAAPATASARPGRAPTSVAEAAQGLSGASCRTPVDLTRRAPGQATATRFAVRNHETAASAYDRVVINLDRPAANYQVHYVRRVIADGSGLPVSLRGDADLEVRISDAVAHDDQGTSTVPVRNHVRNWTPLRQATLVSDVEGVLQVGIGLSTRVDFRVLTLTGPDRLVIDLAVPGQHPWTCTKGLVKVWFFNEPNYAAATGRYFTPVWRRVAADATMPGSLSSLFHGPLLREHKAGLRFLSSEATGFKKLRVRNAIARVQLTGGCNAGGSTVSIAGEIGPTLKQFWEVDYVKIYDPSGQTGTPTGPVNSIPYCLEP